MSLLKTIKQGEKQRKKTPNSISKEDWFGRVGSGKHTSEKEMDKYEK